MKRLALLAVLALVVASTGWSQSPPPVPSPSATVSGGAAPPMLDNEALRRILYALWNPLQTTALSPVGSLHEAQGQVTATNTAATLVSARPTRISCVILNTDRTNTVYIGAATVTSGNGFILSPGKSIAVSAVTTIQVIAPAGSPVVTFWDEYN